jgi:hypothetical protein
MKKFTYLLLHCLLDLYLSGNLQFKLLSLLKLKLMLSNLQLLHLKKKAFLFGVMILLLHLTGLRLVDLQLTGQLVNQQLVLEDFL